MVVVFQVIELPYIFDRFYQAKNAGRGTGIGLAIVKAFTELHHGEVSATSVEGKGVPLLFIFLLDRKER